MEESIRKSIKLAEMLQQQITQNLSQTEKTFHSKMQKLLQNPKNKVMLIELLDKSFRTQDRARSFDLITSILSKYGIADFFTPMEKILLGAFCSLGKLAPSISVPFFISQIKNDTKAMVLDANPKFLEQHIGGRAKQGITINVNLIGEEVLGEEESLYRVRKYEEALKSSYITYISIKITTIFSQINIIDFEYSKDEIVKRLKGLYALALEESKKQKVRKFINLDMEEFRDLELTVASFMEAISEFPELDAGIVLQAYIPDSYEYLKVLHAFSKERVLKGGKPIKIRFVKGANMEAEETIASQRGWELPTFKNKVDTDSNYKKMLDFILSEDNYKYINIGIASHNIFEIAYAYTRIQECNAQDFFTFEMLEGMSLQASYELSQMHSLILYAPVCDEAHFNNAIAYLVRRLDENTSDDNFMRYFFNLKVGDSNWEQQKQLFLQSLKQMGELDNQTHRQQNRLSESSGISSYTSKSFVNEPDTDFILPQNREWAQEIKRKYTSLPLQKISPVAGEELRGVNKLTICSKINLDQVIAEVELAGEQEIKTALEVAKASSFSQKSHDEIYQILAKTAQIMRERRGDLIGMSSLEVGKTFIEVDAEVSEAIDFLEFYPHSLEKLKEQYPDMNFSAKGIGVVISPWNFPVGIPVGTIAAPLAAGNVVIFKPSSLSAVVGYEICKCFWDAGVPKDALIYLPASGKDISEFLLKDEAVNFAVLTGGEETAYEILKANPRLILSAETGGKNATIVTKMADRDMAIKNIVHSAFSNSGQKCSATSLLILEREVYEDENFKKTLVDATKSMNVGNPFELKNKLGTLAAIPNQKISEAMNELKSHESWALKPGFVGDNVYLMTPGIKYGTKKGDFTHMTELFCPILSVMCAENLDDALEIANSTGYGLTSGLESLDEREWEYYLERIEAGNVYINKPTTGAIVLRQPFGGMKKSAIGFGRKVGIYNYITQFLELSENKQDSHSLQTPLSNSLKELGFSPKIVQMAENYAYYYKSEFSEFKEYVKIRGEENLFGYKPIKNMLYRLEEKDSLEDIMGVVLACSVANVSLCISYEKANEALELVRKNFTEISCIYESETDFISRMKEFERIRYFGESDKIYQGAGALAKVIVRDKPLSNGRFELLYYFNEQSLSISYHRYGNLGSRGLK